MSIHFPGPQESVVLKFRLSICFQATSLAAAICLLSGSLLWCLEKYNLYKIDTMFTASRNTEDSVVDRREKKKISCVVVLH